MLQRSSLIARFVSLSLIAVGIAITASSSGAWQFGGPALLEPTTYTSSDGTWTLHVDPTARHGEGAGRYELKHAGKVAWSGSRPITLHDAVVTDEGIAAGYAYSDGVDGRENGTFHVVIFAPDGSTRLDESTRREGSQFMHTAPNPNASGLFLHADLGRFVVRVLDPDVNRAQEEWWEYELSTGKLLSKARPAATQPKDDALRFIVAAHAVRGTPLTLVQWWRPDFSSRESTKLGTRFALLDPDRKPVWELVLPTDYNVPVSEDAQDALMQEIWRDGAVLSVSEPRRFTLRVAAENVRAIFEVAREEPSGAAERWSVREIERSAYKPAAKAKEQVPSPLALREIGVVALELGRGRASGPVRDIDAFAFTSKGTLRFVRREEPKGSFTCVDLDAQGAPTRETRVRPFDHELVGHTESEREGRALWSALAGDSWLFSLSPYGPEARARAWRVDAASGDVVELANFECPSIDAAAPLRKDGFAVLGTYHFKYTQTDALIGFDAQGKKQWEVTGGPPTDALFSPEDMTVLTDGTIAVLENITNRIQLFEPAGKLRTSLALEQLWKRKPRYPSDISADVDGNMLVHDFNGSPLLVRMKTSGEVLAGFDPARPDGQKLPDLARTAAVAPDGRIWATDRRTLQRLDDSGHVDLTLGDEVRADELTEPEGASIDARGRILIQDARTAAVHVFTSDGKPAFVCRPVANDVDDASSLDPPVASGSGGVFVNRGSGGAPRFVEFDATGKRIGLRDLPISGLCAAAGSTCIWGRGEGGLVRIDGEGKASAPIERLPDQRWIDGVEALAQHADGTLYALHWSSSDGGGSKGSIAAFDADGKALRQYALPSSANGRTLSVAGDWLVVGTWDPHVYLVSRATGQVRIVDVPASAKKGSLWCHGLSPDGKELWMFEVQALQLHRFALPN